MSVEGAAPGRVSGTARGANQEFGDVLMRPAYDLSRKETTMPAEASVHPATPPSRPVYRYFISYATASGFGRTEVALRRPMRSLADVEVVEKLLIDHNGFQLAVMGWQRFEQG